MNDTRYYRSTIPKKERGLLLFGIVLGYLKTNDKSLKLLIGIDICEDSEEAYFVGLHLPRIANKH